MQEPPLQLVTLFIDPKLFHTLNELADKADRTRSSVYAEALEKYAVEHHVPTEEQLRRPFTDAELLYESTDIP